MKYEMLVITVYNEAYMKADDQTRRNFQYYSDLSKINNKRISKLRPKEILRVINLSYDENLSRTVAPV